MRGGGGEDRGCHAIWGEFDDQRLTDEADVGDVVDDGPAVELGERRKEHGSGSEAEDVDGDAEGGEFLARAVEFLHEVGNAGGEHGCNIKSVYIKDA